MNNPQHHNALDPGHEVNWYHIEKVLGQGAFGITYLARDRNLDTDVALKEYFPSAWAVRLPGHEVRPAAPEHAGDFDWGLQSFLREGRILVRFDHPCLVRVMSVFEANGTAYLVMRFERGADLRQVLRHSDQLAETDVKDFISPLLDGLRQMHSAGVIHRDIKPDNIFIRADGRPLLLDFGAARQLMGGKSQDLTSVGTAGYAPIEQYADEEGRQGPWTDIYALGATVYHAVAGRAPKDALVRANDILAGAPDPLIKLGDRPAVGFSREFLRAVDHAVAFHSADRPQSVEDFARELGIELGTGYAAAPPASGGDATEAFATVAGVAPYPATAKLTDPDLVDTNQWEIDGIKQALEEERAKPPAASETLRTLAATTVTVKNPADAWRTAVGPSNQAYYVTRFAGSRGRPGLSWNWAAALLTGAWFMYRKLYLWALVVYPAIALGSLAGAWWLAGVAFPGAPLAQVSVMGAWFVLLSLFAGLCANAVYARHLQHLIDETARLNLPPGEQSRWLARKGGTSATLAAIHVVVVLASLGGGGWAAWQFLLRSTA